MKKYCFHPPKNIIVGTLAAMLWVAVFPFWLLGESTPLNALVSGEVPLWDALTRLTTQDYSNITRAKWDGMLIFTMLTLLLTISTLFRREKRRKLPLMLMLLFLLWTGLSCFFGSHAGEMNAWGVPTVLWGSGLPPILHTLCRTAWQVWIWLRLLPHRALPCRFVFVVPVR